MSFSVLTLNTWKCDGDYWARLPLMADTLGAHRPDIILLQEVFRRPDGYADTGAFLAGRLDMYVSYLAARAKPRCLDGVLTDSESGLAVLTRSRPRYAAKTILPHINGDGDRWAQDVGIEVDGRVVRIINTHLTHVAGDDGPLRQARHLIANTQRDDGAAIVVGGDFNAASGSPTIRWLSRQQILPLRRAAMDRPTLTDSDDWVDHLFVSPPLAVIAAERVCDEADTLGRLPSDHFGILVGLRFG